MTPDYEYLTDNDIAALQAEAAYYDQLAQEQAAAPQPQRIFIVEAKNHHLALAAKHIEEYDERTKTDRKVDTPVRQLFEDRAYKRAMMHAAYAQADAAARQAAALESLCEFAGELIGSADLVNALMQWSYRQKAG